MKSTAYVGETRLETAWCLTAGEQVQNGLNPDISPATYDQRIIRADWQLSPVSHIHTAQELQQLHCTHTGTHKHSPIYRHNILNQWITLHEYSWTCSAQNLSGCFTIIGWLRLLRLGYLVLMEDEDSMNMNITTRLVGWLQFSVPFQHKYGCIRDDHK